MKIEVRHCRRTRRLESVAASGGAAQAQSRYAHTYQVRDN